MGAVLAALLAGLATIFRSRGALQLEIVALRHQPAIYQRTVKRSHLQPRDRIFWSWISRDTGNAGVKRWSLFSLKPSSRGNANVFAITGRA
jgi:hypothetical protein